MRRKADPIVSDGGRRSGDWNHETLLAYLSAIIDERQRLSDQRFADLDQALKTALISSEKAISKSELALEKRFDNVNEFRKTLSDQTMTFITRAESDVIVSNLRQRLDDLANRLNHNEGRGSGLNAGWGYLLALIGVLAMIATIYLAIKR